ncbi:MetS family NSS transporter small subunit [Clostridium sp. MSJ-8]|nr:MetS family NSS transporter small subunit [Clostridium sp. MSJ-8]MBU5486679.1 MetS family NSS transporter small subunit [Clostridium sp. MSJ-8]
MNKTAFIFFILGATVLYGGLITTIIISIKKGKEK